MEQNRETLASRLADAKRAEDQAKAVRVQAEEALALSEAGRMTGKIVLTP